jgi:hypothetical protein
MNLMLKAAVLKIQPLLNRFDSVVLSAPLDFTKRDHHPIFILGAPRSGSTILYQILLKSVDAGYISNVMALAPIKMVALARLLRRYHTVTSVKKSHFGFIDGLFSPSEAGALQRFWFGNDMDSESVVWVRNTFILLSTIFNGPMIIKNLFNAFRLNRIRSIFPEARFIFMRRDPLFNAQSLLVARRKINGSENIWWSIQPEGYEKTLNREPEFQVLWQILETEKKLETFFKSDNLEPFHAQYETLCTNPELTIANIAGQMNLNLRKTFDHDNHDTIVGRNLVRLSNIQWDRLSDNYAILKNEI